MKKLKLTMGDYVVYARLHDDVIPKTIAEIEAQLPAEGYIRHARICDNEWMLPLPFPLDVEPENRVRPNPGDIGYNRMGQFFCAWFAPMGPLGWTNLIATVDEKDMEEYHEQMKHIWEKPGDLVRVEIVEVDE